MRLTVFTEPQQGATYDQLLRVARHAEAAGFEAFFRSDHFRHFGGDGLPGPTDAWATLAGLARETTTIRLGTMVTSATFRLPGPLAITVAQVDAMSDGRVELGLGAGWYAAEHTAYGIPFPGTGERFDRLEEQLSIITGLWAATGPFEFHGKHYDLTDSPALPKPVQKPGPPVIIGGRGPTRTPNLAARFATEYNVPFSSVALTREAYERVATACAGLGRDALPLFSAAQTVCVGRDDAEIERRAAAAGSEPDALRQSGLCGTPAEVVDKIGQFVEAGAGRIHLQVLDIHDLEHLDLIAAAVAPQLP